MQQINIGQSSSQFSFGLEIGGNLPYSWDLFEQVSENGAIKLVTIEKKVPRNQTVSVNGDPSGRTFQYRAKVINQAKRQGVDVRPYLVDTASSRYDGVPLWTPEVPSGGGLLNNAVRVER